jgi:predicted phosphodiesterase
MKIGIFSDIHGHLNEVQKTIALLDSLTVDEIIRGGDLGDKAGEADRGCA